MTQDEDLEPNPEDLKILDLTLSKLEEYVDTDVSGFRVDKNNHYNEDFYFDEDPTGTFTAKQTVIVLKWKPYKYSWTTKEYDQSNHNVVVEYRSVTGTVSISIPGKQMYMQLGEGASYKDYKIRFIRMVNRILEWQNEEMPRREREAFTQQLTKTFPDIFDSFILEEEYE